MGVSEILAQIDREIAQLQHARALLAGKTPAAPKKTAAVKATRKTAKKKRKTVDAEILQRILDAEAREHVS